MSVDASPEGCVRRHVPAQWWLCVSFNTKAPSYTFESARQHAFWTLKHAIDKAGQPMRSPVRSIFDGDTLTVCFLTDRRIDTDENGVEARQEPTGWVWVRRFGGWLSDDVVKAEHEATLRCIDESNVQKRWATDQYNVPWWPLIGRHNEIVLFES